MTSALALVQPLGEPPQPARLAGVHLGVVLGVVADEHLGEARVEGLDVGEQLQRVGGDAGRYDLEIRPELVIEAIRELQEAGVEADIWKIEGLDRRGDCERAATQARSGGRDGVACIVLGRGADEAKVLEWLKVGAGVPGYIGFAVGRTLWWNELEAYVGGKLQRGEAAERIAGNYRRMIAAYTS
jgi:hypothetical protein